jgi:hypothetical protein
MENNKLNEANYTSDGSPKSQIAKKGFSQFLQSLWGWRQRGKDKKKFNSLVKQRNDEIDFVKVDLGSEERIKQAKNARIISGPMSERLEKLFQAWLQDTTNTFADVEDRLKRMAELEFMYYNDPFISRLVNLEADEGSQMDVQDRLIGIECPDPRQTKRMYELLIQWGVTQNRVRSALHDLSLIGDSFWANKVSEKGVERIIPLRPRQITDRLEFSPTRVAEDLLMKDSFIKAINKDQKLKLMLSTLEEMTTDEFSDLFDTKLFGFALDSDLVVPPWNITHFRMTPDQSEYYPWGKPRLVMALAAFKQAASTMTLQSLARLMSFPITVMEVQTSPGMAESEQFDAVNKAREEFENVGLNPSSGMSETYSVNTKMWMPKGLIDVSVKASEVPINFVEDLEMYTDRVVVAAGVPKGYLVQEWGGFGNSAVSLVEQFKPFARQVYTNQSAFLQGLADLFRLHFVIANEGFDYKTPFTLSLRFPAEESSEEKRTARNDSLDFSTAIIDTLKSALGIDDEDFPPDVAKDILAKFSFLDPVDLAKWTSLIDAGKKPDETSEDDEDKDKEDKDSGFDFPDEDEEDTSDEDEEEDLDFGEKAKRRNFNMARMREISTRYSRMKEEIYFKVLRENSFGEFVRNKRHVILSDNIHFSMDLMYNTLNEAKKNPNRLKEVKEKTITDLLQEYRGLYDPSLQKTILSENIDNRDDLDIDRLAEEMIVEADELIEKIELDDVENVQ